MKHVHLSAAFLAALFISACGGGTPAASVPAAPTSVTVTAGDAQVTPSWTAVSGATSYNAYYGTAAGITIANGKKVTGATSGASITGLTNGTTYYVAVTAVNADGESALSSEASATPQAPVAAPAAPTSVNATAGNAQAAISWTAVTDATSYNVYYGTAAGVTTANGKKVAGATSGSAVNGLANGIAYYFVVTAVNATGESTVSNEVSATPVNTAPAITSFTPTTGVVGTTVTITGTNFSSTAANNAVSFNGTSASPTAATATSITVTVPSGATSGAISVTTAAGTATSAANFTVQALLGGAIQGKPLNLTGTVTTIAGSVGVAGPTDGAGTAALLRSPYAITTDGTNLFFTERNGTHTIRKMVIATGEVTTLAGTYGIPGSADGSGANATFNQPCGITTDGTNLYVTEIGTYTFNADGTITINGGHTIRKIVISTGEVTTIAGTAGTPGTADGTGAAASFMRPENITIVNNALYVTDGSNGMIVGSAPTPGNSTIRKIDLATNQVTTIAGTPGVLGSADGIGGAASFQYVDGIATDGTNLFVTDNTPAHTIRKIELATRQVTTIAGTTGVLGAADGKGSAASFNEPEGITTDGTNLYVTTLAGNTVVKIVIATGEVTTIAGAYICCNLTGNLPTDGVPGSADGVGSAASFNRPVGITTDGTNLYVIDRSNRTIRKIQGASATPQAAATTFAMADLVGTWDRNRLQAGRTITDTTGAITSVTSNWNHGTETVDALGNSVNGVELTSNGNISSGVSSVWSLSADGIITDAADPSFHGTVSGNKDLIVGTRTAGNGIDPRLIVLQKQNPAVTFTMADLAGTWDRHMIRAGRTFTDTTGTITSTTNKWERGVETWVQAGIWSKCPVRGARQAPMCSSPERGR